MAPGGGSKATLILDQRKPLPIPLDRVIEDEGMTVKTLNARAARATLLGE